MRLERNLKPVYSVISVCDAEAGRISCFVSYTMVLVWMPVHESSVRMRTSIQPFHARKLVPMHFHSTLLRPGHEYLHLR